MCAHIYIYISLFYIYSSYTCNVCMYVRVRVRAHVTRVRKVPEARYQREDCVENRCTFCEKG